MTWEYVCTLHHGHINLDDVLPGCTLNSLGIIFILTHQIPLLMRWIVIHLGTTRSQFAR